LKRAEQKFSVPAGHSAGHPGDNSNQVSASALAVLSASFLLLPLQSGEKRFEEKKVLLSI